MKLAHDQNHTVLSHRQVSQLPDDPAILKRLLRSQATYLQTRPRRHTLSEADLFHLFDHLKTSAVMGYTGDGRIVYWNQTCYQLYGYTARDAVGANFIDLLVPKSMQSAVRDRIYPDSIHGSSNSVQELTLLRKGGGTLPIQASSLYTYQIDAEPLLFVLHTDQSHYVRTREALQESELRFHHLTDASPQGVLVHRGDKPLFMNQAFATMLGYDSPEPLMQKGTLNHLIAPPDQVRVQNHHHAHLIGQDAPTTYTYYGVRQDGSHILLENHVQSVLWDGLPALQCMVTEISEHHSPLEQQYHAKKMEAVSTLAGGIAHEFNNILAAMLGFTELTQDLMPEGSTAWNNLQEVYTAGQRAKEFMQQVLAFSRPQASVLSPVRYAPLLTEICGLLCTSLPPEVECCQQIPPDLGWVLSDRTRMHQIIHNLWSNALQSMQPKGGVLEISAQTIDITHAFAAHHPPLKPGPHIQLTVQDTGHGISPATQLRIFDPFFTTKEVGKGTGMGLAIVHGIVMSHQGAITVESAPTQGSVFTVYLPQVSPPVRGKQLDDLLRSSPLPTTSGCVLFVDDECALAQAGQSMLQRLGYAAEIATNPHEALTRFQAEPERFTCIITDQTMPHMTGIQLAHRIRELRPEIPIILCTGFSQSLNSSSIKEFGLNGFLMKPFDSQELATTIDRALIA